MAWIAASFVIVALYLDASDIVGLQCDVYLTEIYTGGIQVYGNLNLTRDILWINSVRGDQGSTSLTQIPMWAYITPRDECSLGFGA